MDVPDSTINCEVTGNPFGTDTWNGYWDGAKWVGDGCRCKTCSRMMALWDEQLAKLPYFAEVVIAQPGVEFAPPGAVGLTLGLAPPIRPDDEWVYAVYMKETEECVMVPSSLLLPTGEHTTYEQFYANGPKLRVRVDEYGSGQIA